MTEPVKPSPSSIFRAMADRIDLNPADFAGAYVVVGPDGTIIQNALFSPPGTSSTQVFWGLTKNHIVIESDLAAEKAAQGTAAANAYGRPR